MFSTDNLFFLILFIVPGAFFLLFKRFLRPIPIVEKDETIRLSGALIFSFMVFSVNALLLNRQLHIFVNQSSIFEDISLLFLIIFVNIILSLVASVVWTIFSRNCLYRISNAVNRLLKRPTITKNNSVWIDIFEDRQFGDVLDGRVVKIEKDGLVSCGILHMYSSPTAESKEIVLEHTSRIQEYFDKDKEKTNSSDKYFDEIIYEYINLTEGYKITFFKMDKYKRFVEQQRAFS